MDTSCFIGSIIVFLKGLKKLNLTRFILNEKELATELPPGTLLLDYIRYHRHLMGTKIGCREGDCGACTVLVGELKNDELVYTSATSCLMALANAEGKHIVTIEGVNTAGLNPIQQAMSDEAATQCGFCTPGFVVSLAGFCLSETEHNYKNAIASIDGNICRCTGYKSIERAAAKVSEVMGDKGKINVVDFGSDNGILPSYFKQIKNRLRVFSLNGNGSTTNGERFLGGGTDLYVQQPEAMTHTNVNPLFSKTELNGIYESEAKCYVGAAATVTDVLSSPIFIKHFPQLHKFIKLVSSTPIRNMATVGGNMVNASPIGDMTIFFLALDAQLVLSDGKNERTSPLRSFYKGYKQLDKKPEEFVRQIIFSLPGSNNYFNFEKVSKRTHLDIASVNSAMLIELADNKILQGNISAGGVGPIPMCLKNASQFFAGKELNEETILEAIKIAQDEVSPISDVRGSEEYKRLLLSQLIKAHFIELFPSISFEKMFSHR
jgi:xanthine dehydrogenase small subunit